MSKKATVKYTDNPEIGELIEIPKDFLPSPEALVFKNPSKKVTITLDEKSIRFFKAEAERLHVSYQRMIRNLLHEYVERQQERNPPSHP